MLGSRGASRLSCDYQPHCVTLRCRSRSPPSQMSTMHISAGTPPHAAPPHMSCKRAPAHTRRSVSFPAAIHVCICLPPHTGPCSRLVWGGEPGQLQARWDQVLGARHAHKMARGQRCAMRRRRRGAWCIHFHISSSARTLSQALRVLACRCIGSPERSPRRGASDTSPGLSPGLMFAFVEDQ